MSKDIRSFFKAIPKKPDTSTSTKKRPVALDSDSDDVIPVTPDQKTKKRPKKTLSDSDDDVIQPTPDQKSKKRPKLLTISDSDEENQTKPAKADRKAKKAPKLDKLKPAKASDFFKSTPVKQSRVQTPPKVEKAEEKAARSRKSTKKSKTNERESKAHDDVLFERTLIDLDDDFESDADRIFETIAKVEPKKGKKRPASSIGELQVEKKTKIEHKDSGFDEKTPKTPKTPNLNKSGNAALYHQFLNRSAPRLKGLKQAPSGLPTCLANLCFITTGVLDSLDRDEFNDFIVKHGGRTVKSVSGKVNYIVIGEEPGQSKTEKAKKLKIKELNENELFDLVLVKSGKEPKYVNAAENGQIDSDEFLNELESGSVSPSSSKSVKQDPVTPKKVTASPKLIQPIDNSSPKVKQNVKQDLKLVNQDSKLVKQESVTSNKHSSPVKVSQTISCSSKQKPDVRPVKHESNRVVKATINVENQPFWQKYQPKTIDEIIGQQGHVAKLKSWLLGWSHNQKPNIHATIQKPSLFNKNHNGAYYKAVLLSGPPGVGKTTTATLVAKLLNFDLVEFNASDTRNKRLLHEHIGQLLSSKTIRGYQIGNEKNVGRVLIMDEVDGMSGNEDRGGMQELIQLIKTSKIPIICICNDRNHQKMRSLVNYCFELRFTNPSAEQISHAFKRICHKEGIQIDSPALTKIIIGTGCDVRQTLNNLSLYKLFDKNVTLADATKSAENSKKDVILGPWDTLPAVFSDKQIGNFNIHKQLELFFYDYSIGPLFVQENYIAYTPKGCNTKQTIAKLAQAAEDLSMGDCVDATMRKTNDWSLLNIQALYNSVLPGYTMAGQLHGHINFPAWLGNNSKKNKTNRLVGELQAHTRLTLNANRRAMQMDYLLPLRDLILSPLVKKGADGVRETVDLLKAYNLRREDIDSLVELNGWITEKGKNPMDKIEPKVKAALTRLYNKEVSSLPYTVSSKKKVKVSEYGDEDDEQSDDEEDDNIDNNPMIKKKTYDPKAKGKAGTSKGKASTAKAAPKKTKKK